MTTTTRVFQKILIHMCEKSIFLLDEIRTAWLYPTEPVQPEAINKAQPWSFEARMQWSDNPEPPRFYGFLIT